MKHCAVLAGALTGLALAAGGNMMTAVDFDRETGLVGTDYWAGLRRHPATVNAVGRERDDSWISLAGEWAFTNMPHGCGKRTVKFRLEEPWPAESKILVPGCWEAQGVGGPGMGVPHLCSDCAPRMISGTHHGEGFYRRRFDVPGSWAGKRVWLKVGCVRSRGWFYVNDHAVGMLDVYAGAWKYDITKFVTPGASAKIVVDADNVVASRNGQVSSTERWGGIVRDIEVEATPEVCIDDAWVRGDFDRREAEVHVGIDAPDGFSGGGRRSVRVTVEGETREAPVKSLSGEVVVRVPLRDFRPWSPESPNLYWATIELLEDGKATMSRKERFGVRKLEVRGKEFFLNGRPFFARGFGDDSVYPLSGITPPSREYHLEHFRRARAAGFNYVRLHTHCETPEYFEAADEAGIMIQPELSYYLDEPDDAFDYNPVRDAVERWVAFRRHPSYAFNSSGNEGRLGPGAGKILYGFLRRLDPDRLVIEQDGGAPECPDNGLKSGDFITGPLNTWERGSFDPPTAWICHEYMNLCVKGDSRDENKYTGTWMPPITRADRAKWLSRFGLGMEWGDRLQDAQHALQKFWQKNGIEHARKDPLCDGYCYWTIVDVSVYSEKFGVATAQGLFNPFWEPKRCGSTPEEFAVFNSPSCILLDTQNRDRSGVASSERLAKNWCIPGKPEETNCVYCAGETIPFDFILAHYGDADLADAKLAWSIAAPGGRVLGSGARAIGDQKAGPARSVAKDSFTVPALDKPTKAVLSVSVSDASGGRAISNSWNFWLFPRRARRKPSANTIVCAYGSDEARAARAAGRNLVLLGKCGDKPNVRLGWWWMGKQVGVAFEDHDALGDFPREDFLAPLHFRLLREGQALPVDGFSEADFIAVGEGSTETFLHLAAKERPDGGREVFVSGLDVMSDTPEGISLYNSLLEWAEKRPVAVIEPGRVEVVVAADAKPAVLFAADEATNFLSRVLGRAVPVVGSPSGDGKISIVLGESPWAAEAGFTAKGLPWDSFATRVRGDRIYIYGHDDPEFDIRANIAKAAGHGPLFAYRDCERATLFGVYDFLERFAGCRFYFPHELGEIVPRADRIVVADADRVVTPSFLIRNPYFNGDGRWLDEKDKNDRCRLKSLAWLRLRMSTTEIPCCHGSQHFNYTKRFAATHPEFFALKENGERWTNPKVFAAFQYCWSNPGFQEELYQDVKAYLTGKPASSRGLERWGYNCVGGKYVDIMANDAFFSCLCGKCRPRESHVNGVHDASEMVWEETAKIANRLTAEGIPGYVTQMAYPPYRRVPEVAIPSNVLVMVAERGPWAKSDPKGMERDNAELREWAKKLGRPVWTWTYPGKHMEHVFPGIPNYTPRAVGEYYKAVAQWTFGAFMESESDAYLYNHMNYYMLSRASWDSGFDVDATLDEYYALMYGPAEKPAKAFFEALEDKWVFGIMAKVVDTNVGPKVVPPPETEIWGRLYSMEFLASARKSLEPFAVGDSIYARRVRLILDNFVKPLEEHSSGFAERLAKIAALKYSATDARPMVLSPFRMAKGSDEVRTEATIRREADELVVRYKCWEPRMEAAHCPLAGRDDQGKNWQKNCVEFFLNVSGDRRTYYQFVVTMKGEMDDFKVVQTGSGASFPDCDISWNSGAKVVPGLFDGGYTLEVRIPVASFGEPVGASFPANFGRDRVLAGEKYSYDIYSWSPFLVGYHDPVGFGTVLPNGDFGLKGKIAVWGYLLDKTPTACPYMSGKTEYSLERAAAEFGVGGAMYMNSLFNRDYVLKYFKDWDRECFSNCIDNRLSEAQLEKLRDVPEVWCATTHGKKLESSVRIAELSLKYPNIVGVNFDDFGIGASGGEVTLEKVRAIKAAMHAVNPKLKVSVVSYAKDEANFNIDLTQFRDEIDHVSRWKWNIDEKYWRNYRADIAELRRQIGPKVKVVQGLYFHNFGAGAQGPVPLEYLKLSVSTALDAVADGTIDGIILPQVAWYSHPDHREHFEWLREKIRSLEQHGRNGR